MDVWSVPTLGVCFSDCAQNAEDMQLIQATLAEKKKKVRLLRSSVHHILNRDVQKHVSKSSDLQFNAKKNNERKPSNAADFGVLAP